VYVLEFARTSVVPEIAMPCAIERFLEWDGNNQPDLRQLEQINERRLIILQMLKDLTTYHNRGGLYWEARQIEYIGSMKRKSFGILPSVRSLDVGGVDPIAHFGQMKINSGSPAPNIQHGLRCTKNRKPIDYCDVLHVRLFHITSSILFFFGKGWVLLILLLSFLHPILNCIVSHMH